MEIFELISRFEEILENAKSMPFSDKILIDGEEAGDLLQEIKLKLPDEIKQAKWVREEREKILVEAHNEADEVVKEAENRIIAMIDEHGITKKAYEHLGIPYDEETKKK